MTGERKFQNEFCFYNTARLIFSANEVPESPKIDDVAYFRRWILIDFPHKFEGKNKVKGLIDSLNTEEELSGLLNLALTALERLIKTENFSNSHSTEETKDVYVMKSSPVSVFAKECILISSTHCNKDIVYNTYVEWCLKNNIIKKLTKNILCQKLKALGYGSVRIGNDWSFEGISVKTASC